MCTYCNTDNYRKIYESHYGPIPVDQDGRTYEIHHIDNNHNNNSFINLKAVSIQEHYNIHYEQKDWAACLIMSDRMKTSFKEKSELARKSNLNRVANGTNPFLDPELARKHTLKRIQEGTHNFIGDRHPNFKGRLNRKWLEEGTHPSQKKINCEHCNRIFSIGNYKRWHGNNCRNKV
jgi:hypothetical protein